MSTPRETPHARTRIIIAAVAAALLIISGGIFLVWLQSQPESATAVPDPHAHHGGTGQLATAAPAPLPAPENPATAAPSPDPTASRVAVDLAQGVAVQPPEAPSAGSAPQVSLVEAIARQDQQRTGAQELGAPRASVDPADVMSSSAAALGGCHPAYGTDGQCLPAIPPSMADHAAAMRDAGMDPATMDHPWACEEVAMFFPDGVAVRVPGVDPDGLDPDGNGVACDPGG